MARLIDAVLVMMIYYVLARITKDETITLVPASTTVPFALTKDILVLYVSSLLIFWFCNIVLIIKNGQTIGKKLTRIKVVNKENAISLKIVFLREMFFYCGITPFVVFAGFTFGIETPLINIIDLITWSHVVLDEKI